jgi:hypothetical protein
MSGICFDDELMEDAARLCRLWEKYVALSDYEQRLRQEKGGYGTFQDFMSWLFENLDRVNNSKPINTPKPNVSNRPNR